MDRGSLILVAAALWAGDVSLGAAEGAKEAPGPLGVSGSLWGLRVTAQVAGGSTAAGGGGEPSLCGCEPGPAVGACPVAPVLIFPPASVPNGFPGCPSPLPFPPRTGWGPDLVVGLGGWGRGAEASTAPTYSPAASRGETEPGVGVRGGGGGGRGDTSAGGAGGCPRGPGPRSPAPSLPPRSPPAPARARACAGSGRGGDGGRSLWKAALRAN